MNQRHNSYYFNHPDDFEDYVEEFGDEAYQAKERDRRAFEEEQYYEEEMVAGEYDDYD